MQGARDSGVDSVLSLAHHGSGTLDDDPADSWRDHGGVPPGTAGLDGLRLADIRIPAAGDDDREGTNDDEDDDDGLCHSHYEDIDVLDPPTARRPTLPAATQPDDLYLDPRHPDPSASLRRQMTGRYDRFGYTSVTRHVSSTQHLFKYADRINTKYAAEICENH